MESKYNKYHAFIAEICQKYGYHNCHKCPLFTACNAEKGNGTDAEEAQKWEDNMAAAYESLGDQHYILKEVYTASSGLLCMAHCGYITNKSTLFLMAENAAEINLEGVTEVVFDLDTRRIIQTRGYTDTRGVFCDLY